MATQELKSVLVKMPREIKTPLVAQCVETATSVNDVAVGILADRLSFAFAPSGRKPAFRPDPGTEDVVLRIPDKGKRKIQAAALRSGLNMTDFVNQQIAAHFGVDWEAHGRTRVPFGGGSRAVASA